MKKVFIAVFSVLICVSICLLLIHENVFPRKPATGEESQPALSQLPDFSGTITDIRVTGVECPMPFDPDGQPFGEPFVGSQPVQIYYGYLMDGQWIDLPCENYSIISFSGSDTGYDAADSNHFVQIGPYLLISVRGSTRPDAEPVFSDTLGTTWFAPLSQYHTMDADPDRVIQEEYPYCYLKGSVDTENLELRAPFRPRYYMVVPMDQITDDYAVTYHEDPNAADAITLTGKEIRYYLDWWTSK